MSPSLHCPPHNIYSDPPSLGSMRFGSTDSENLGSDKAFTQNRLRDQIMGELSIRIRIEDPMSPNSHIYRPNNTPSQHSRQHASLPLDTNTRFTHSASFPSTGSDPSSSPYLHCINAMPFSSGDSTTQGFCSNTGSGYSMSPISVVHAYPRGSICPSTNGTLSIDDFTLRDHYNSANAHLGSFTDASNFNTHEFCSNGSTSRSPSTPTFLHHIFTTPSKTPTSAHIESWVNNHTPTHVSNGHQPQPGQTSRNTYACNIAGCHDSDKRYNAPRLRLIHARKAHRHLFFCNSPDCPKMEDYTVFETKLSLDKHWRLEHQTSKRFRCCLCWHSTENITNMREHLKRHYPTEGDLRHAMQKTREEKNRRNKQQEPRKSHILYCESPGWGVKRGGTTLY